MFNLSVMSFSVSTHSILPHSPGVSLTGLDMLDWFLFVVNVQTIFLFTGD